MKDNFSPEEKLLKLIKGDKKTVSIPFQEPPVEKNPDFKKPVFSFNRFYFSGINIHKILRVILAISVVYLAAALIYPLLGFRKIRLPSVSKEKNSESKSVIKEEPKPFEFYAQGIGNRQIFASSSSKSAPGPLAVANADLIKNISLIGIISGVNPQAVIEDKIAQKTYYLNKGQLIGEFQIDDIREGKVILDYRGKKYELYM